MITDPAARLAFLVALDVVLEVDAGIERAVGLLRLVFEVDLGELQRDVLRGRRSPLPPWVTLVMMTSFILTIRNSCWPLPALRA